MIEAQIICCEPVEILDLGLRLQRGESVWVDDLVARNSSDLRRAQAMGKVRVKRKQRRPTQKVGRPAPPFVQRSRPQPRVYEQEPKETIVKETVVKETVVEQTVVEQKVDTEEVARQVKAELIGDLRATIAEEMGKIMASQAPQEAPESAPAMDATQMASVMESVLARMLPAGGGAPSAGTSARSTQQEEEPLYMPSNLVDKDAKGVIQVASKTSEGADDVDEAAQALRALRKKRKSQGTDE